MKLTFKQYLESKDQLIKAVANTPVSVLEYEVRKYCSLVVGEDEEEKRIISLKPKHKIIVEWRYDNINDPTPLSIKLSGSSDVDESEQFATFWSNEKLKKWLARHTTTGTTLK